MKNVWNLLIILASMNLSAQNLVPNPSFEDTIHCPDFPQPTIDNCQGWSSYGATSDYFNACAGFNSLWNVPDNFPGYQLPKHGIAYSGLVTWCNSPNTREFIGAELISPLTVGTKYYVSFYVSNADSATGLGNYNSSSNNIGIRFTNVQYSENNLPTIDNHSHIHSSTIITDELNWSRISGSFVADSAYEFVMLGNFYDDTNTSVDTAVPSNSTCAYYYIDAICVSTDSLFNETWINVEQPSFSKMMLIFPNPVERYLHIDNTTFSNFLLFNVTGSLIISEIINPGSNLIDMTSIAAGVYIINIDNEFYYKLIVQH